MQRAQIVVHMEVCVGSGGRVGACVHVLECSCVFMHGWEEGGIVSNSMQLTSG